MRLLIFFFTHANRLMFYFLLNAIGYFLTQNRAIQNRNANQAFVTVSIVGTWPKFIKSPNKTLKYGNSLVNIWTLSRNGLKKKRITGKLHSSFLQFFMKIDDSSKFIIIPIIFICFYN